MINHVVTAGRVVAEPESEVTPGGTRRSDLRVEVEHVDRWGEGARETCTVRARFFGDKRAEVVERYLPKDSKVLLTGHLRGDGEGLVLVVDRFEFLPDRLQSRCLWVEPASPPPAPAAARGGGF